MPLSVRSRPEGQVSNCRFGVDRTGRARFSVAAFPVSCVPNEAPQRRRATPSPAIGCWASSLMAVATRLQSLTRDSPQHSGEHELVQRE